MKKTIKRILALTSLVLFVLLSGLATIILFPQPLFANKMEHKGFRVYSNEKISHEIIPILENAMDLVQKSELHDPNYTYDIFLCYKSFFNTIDDKLIGFGPSARATDDNVIIKVEVDIEEDLFFPTFHNNCEGRFTELLAHEMIHCLQANKYGIIKFNPLRHPAMWKLEGYPEYISRQAKLKGESYSLVNEIDRFVELDGKSNDIWISIEEGRCEVPTYYYKGRLMTEYLMDVRHFSYDQILKDKRSPEVVYADMIHWKNGLKEQTP
jgi:hypothetical protein